MIFLQGQNGRQGIDMDNTEELKKQAVEFVMALANPKASVREIAYEGIQAVLALYTVNGDLNGAQSAIQHLRDFVNAK